VTWSERIIKVMRGTVNGAEKASNAAIRGMRKGIDSIDKSQPAASSDDDLSGGAPAGAP
jgi:hypothetical protein